MPIRIDTGMAFGTGTHPATVPCLSTIEMYLKKGDDFLDMGTGSGILMIAAAELGAERVVESTKMKRLDSEVVEMRTKVYWVSITAKYKP